MKKILFVIQLMLLSHLIFAQTEGKPEWSIPLDMPCDWMQMTSTGTVLVSSKLSLFCIDPATKKKIWEIKTTGVKQEDYVEIDGTPLASFENVNPFQSLRTQTTIINYVSGKIIFNSKEADMKIVKKTPFFEIGGILIEFKEDKNYYASLLDVINGESKWKIGISGEAYGKGGFSIKSAIKMAKAQFLAEPTLDGDGNILFPDFQILKRIDAQSGKVLWEQTYPKDLKKLTISDDGKIVYLGSEKKIMAVNISDGIEVWKKPYKINGDFEAFIPIDNDKMYLLTSDEITIIDKKSGQSLWKKPYEFESSFRDLRFTDAGILILCDKTNMGGNVDKSYFHYINSTGKVIWKKPYETKEVLSFRVTPKGVLFTSEDEANMVDMKTGKDLWKTRIKVKGTPVTRFYDKTAYIYTNKALYQINLETATYTAIIEEIELQGKDEEINVVEERENGYFISSSQNMIMIGKTGKIVYQKYYKAPSLGGFGGKVLAFGAKVLIARNNLEVTESVSYDYDGQARYRQTIKVSDEGKAMMSEVNSIVSARKETFTTQNANYILTMVEEGDKKYIGMVKVDKDSGEEKGNIVLKTLNPVYVIDEVSGKLFSTSGNSGVIALQFSCFGL